MIIKNPTDSKIEVVILGNKYEVEPKGELSGVPAQDALHWKTRVHQFIEVYEDVKRVFKEAAEVKEAVAEVVEGVKGIISDAKEDVSTAKKVIGKIIKK